MDLSLETTNNSETIPANTVLFKQGERISDFYIILSGAVACLRENDERLTPIFYAKEKDIVGEDCVLSGEKKYFYSAVVMEDAKVIRIPSEGVKDFLSAQKPWIKNLLSSISGKIDSTTELISEHRIVNDKLFLGSLFDNEKEAQIRKVMNSKN